MTTQDPAASVSAGQVGRVALTSSGGVISDRKTAAQRRAEPVAPEIVEALAAENGICTRPVPMRVTAPDGATRIVGTPCRSTMSHVCEPCAKVARAVRVQQAREGWHLKHEPVSGTTITEPVRVLIGWRCDLIALYRTATGEQDAELVESVRAEIADLDRELAAHGVTRGLEALDAPAPRARIARSTRRSQDEPPLPRRRVDKRTIGRVFGPGYRPGMFLTLTCRSYGPVHPDGSPKHPESYDYRTAARDMISFNAALDRFVEELRRAVGWKVQHWSVVEPQRRGAPHSHSLIRGAVPREVLRLLAAALTYRQYWPAYDEQTHTPESLVWNEHLGRWVDDQGTVLPGFREAAAEVPDTEPSHVFRFGTQVDIKGMIAGTPETDKTIRYVAKYLGKSVADVLDTATAGDRLARHYERLHTELARTPCSPRCGLWPLYGVTPVDATGKTKPGRCRGKAHKREFVGAVGRRCLAARDWSGKDLRDHRADRAEFVREVLGNGGSADPRSGWRWTLPARTDPDIPRRSWLLAAMVTERARWRADYLAALAAAGPPT